MNQKLNNPDLINYLLTEELKRQKEGLDYMHHVINHTNDLKKEMLEDYENSLKDILNTIAKLKGEIK